MFLYRTTMHPMVPICNQLEFHLTRLDCTKKSFAKHIIESFWRNFINTNSIPFSCCRIRWLVILFLMCCGELWEAGVGGNGGELSVRVFSPVAMKITENFVGKYFRNACFNKKNVATVNWVLEPLIRHALSYYYHTSRIR